jgi:DNA polymerase-3 subunit delta
MDAWSLIREFRNTAASHAPVYVLVGPERYLTLRCVDALKSHVLRDGLVEFNYQVFRGGQSPPRTFVEAARTMPMMAPARLVVVHDAGKIGADDLDPLLAYLQKPAEHSCMVLIAEALDGRSRLAKLAKQLGYWVDASTPRPSALPALVRGLATDMGWSIEAEAVSALIETVGDEPAALADAVERVGLYAGVGNPIRTGDVNACLDYGRTASIWSLMDALSNRQKASAVQIAHALLADREPPLRILALLGRQFRMLAIARDALSAGSSKEDAARLAGAPPFKAADLALSARRFSARELTQALQRVHACDIALKSSAGSPEARFVQLVIELTANVRGA